MAQTITTEDESQKCRVCLDNVGIVPIFGDGNNPDISVNLMAFGTVWVQKNDDLPKLICSECFTLLDGAVTFRKTALRSDKLLKERKKINNHPTMPVKIEIEYLENDNETMFTEPHPTSHRNENSNLEMIPEYSKYLNVNVTKDDEHIKSLITIANEKHTAVKEENLINNPCEVTSEGTIKTEITHPSTPEGISKLLTKAEPNLCLKCNKLFPPEHFSKHMMEVHAEDKNPRYNKPYKCEICCMELTENTFAKHIQEVHHLTPNIPPKSKECPICKKLFHPNYLGRHVRVIHNQKVENLPKHRVECPICKTFFSGNYYKVHAKIHELGRKNYICDECGKDFMFPSVLANHKLMHRNEFPFKCDLCPYKGRSKHLLKIHSRTHAEEYPYKCDQCNKQCITKSKLNRHMREHKIAVDFVCDTCNKGFFTKLELEQHVSVTHLGIRNHLCNLCDAAFGYKQGLSKHMRIVHKIRQFKGKNCTYLKIQE